MFFTNSTTPYCLHTVIITNFLGKFWYYYIKADATPDVLHETK